MPREPISPSETPASQSVGISDLLGLGIWFVPWFAGWGGKLDQAVEQYAQTYYRLPASLRPKWLLVTDPASLVSQVVYDLLIQRGLPVVRFFRGAPLKADDEQSVAAHDATNILKDMSHLYNLIPVGLRFDGRQALAVDEVPNSNAGESGVGFENKNLQVVTLVPEGDGEGVGFDVHGGVNFQKPNVQVQPTEGGAKNL